MAQGRGRGKSSDRSNPAIRISMPTIPMPTTVTPQQDGTPTVETSGQGITSTIPETPPITPNQSSPIGQGTFTQSNTIAEGDSSSSHAWILVFLTSAGLFWRIQEKLLLGCFHSESVVKRHWSVKAAVRYRNFISKIKGEGIRPGFVHEDVWERWMQLWGSDECIKKSEINAKNRHGGREVAVGTHIGVSISIGEYHKRLAIEKGRDPTPSELYLHVHTHGHDGKSFVDERSRIVHEKYEEILREKTMSQSDIDQCDAYYQAVGGEKRRIYGLGSEAKNYYGQNLCASSSVPPSVSQSTPTINMDEFVKRMIPALSTHVVPLIIERVQEVITPIDNPSVVTPIVPPATTNVDEVDPLVSSDDHSP